MQISNNAKINPDNACKLLIPKDRNVKDKTPDQDSIPQKLKDSLPQRAGLKFDIDPQEGSYIGLDMSFDTFKISLERNLINELISSIKEISDQISVGSGLNIEQAAKDISKTLKKLIGATEVSWKQVINWDFEKVIPAVPQDAILVIERTVDAEINLNSTLVDYNINVHSTIDNKQIGQDILVDKTTKLSSSKSNKFNDTQRVFFSIKDKKNSIVDDITISVNINGQADKIVELVDGLSEVVNKAGKLVAQKNSKKDVSVGDVVETIAKIGAPVPAYLFSLLKDAVLGEEEKKAPVDVEKVAKELLAEWVKLVKKVLRTEKGDLSITGLSYY